MCGLRTRPRTDADPPRFLDPWTEADGLIGGKTICHRRIAIGGGIWCRRPRDDTLSNAVLLSLALVLGLEVSSRTHFESLALALKVKSLALVLALRVRSLA